MHQIPSRHTLLPDWGLSVEEVHAAEADRATGRWDVEYDAQHTDDEDDVDQDDARGEGDAEFIDELEAQVFMDAYRYSELQYVPQELVGSSGLAESSGYDSDVYTTTPTPRAKQGSVSPRKRSRRSSWDLD